MLIKTQIDVSQGLKLCDLILQKLPYATNNALARTARELVQVEKDALAKVFVERTQFVPSRVQILQWPKANALWTVVGINIKSLKRPALLTWYEQGGEKEPSAGSELAVPLTGGLARPTMEQKVTARLLYKRLAMQKHITATGKVQYKGDLRTFVIPGLGIFQRTGSSKKLGASRRLGRKLFIGKQGAELRETTSTTMIYRFRTGVPLRARMQFIPTAEKFVRGRFQAIWIEEFVKELRGRVRKK